jgi:hypothetical protein
MHSPVPPEPRFQNPEGNPIRPRQHLNLLGHLLPREKRTFKMLMPPCHQILFTFSSKKRTWTFENKFSHTIYRYNCLVIQFANYKLTQIFLFHLNLNQNCNLSVSTTLVLHGRGWIYRQSLQFIVTRTSRMINFLLIRIQIRVADNLKGSSISGQFLHNLAFSCIIIINLIPVWGEIQVRTNTVIWSLR